MRSREIFVPETVVLPHVEAVSAVLHNVRHTRTHNTTKCELQKQRSSVKQNRLQVGQAKWCPCRDSIRLATPQHIAK